VRVLGDERLIMYLSVTPHIHPTHMALGGEGQRLSPRFAPSSTYDVSPDMSVSIEELIDRHLESIEGVAEAAQASA